MTGAPRSAPPSRRVRARRLVAGAVAVAAWLSWAAPAGAHGTAGADASNYRTTLESVVPEVPGLRIEAVAGDQLELANRTGTEAVVLGYEDEPYLRVGPDGTFENRRSPAAYLNDDRFGQTPVPPEADPAAPPEWRRISAEPVVRWHDHRTHWMGAQDPPQVRRDPGRRHVVIEEWAVTVRLGSEAVVARGDLVWVPGPSARPWLALAAALAVGVAALGLSPWWGPALAGALGLLVAADVVHAFGIAYADTDASSPASRLLAGSLVSLVVWAIGAEAARLLVLRRVGGLYLAAAVGFALALYGGAADLGDLSRSQVPFAFSADLARLAVAASLGLGLGLVAAAVLAVRRLGRAAPPAPESTGGAEPARTA